MRGGDGSDAGLVEQVGGDGFDEPADARLQVGGLGGEGLDPRREAAQGLFGGCELVEGRRRQTERGAFGDLGGGGDAASNATSPASSTDSYSTHQPHLTNIEASAC